MDVEILRVRLALFGKGQGAYGNSELAVVTWEVSTWECHGLSIGEATGLYIFLMTGECAWCYWIPDFERTGCVNAAQVCNGTSVAKINFVQGACAYLKTVKAVHCSVSAEKKAGP